VEEELRRAVSVMFDVASIASIWASTEELEMDRWSVEFSAQFIMDLTAHAKRARSEGSSLFLRMSE
jgi:hypothetical protein